MRQLLVVALLIGALIGAQGACADDHDWTIRRDRDGVQVYTRVVEGSKFKAVKSTMTIAAGLGELVALIKDTSACPEWAALCKESRNLEVVSETELFVYTLNNIPWPVADRDAVAHIVWSQDADDGSVTMNATIVSDKLPKNRRIVRLAYGVTSWTFTPTGNGNVEVESRAHVDPGGATPAWLTNMLLVDAPFNTMVGMRTFVGTGRYEGSSFEFLTEP